MIPATTTLSNSSNNTKAGLFFDLLKKQLIFKNIISAEDWMEWKNFFVLQWATDSYFAEVKEAEIQRNRTEIAESMEMFIGKYFSHDYVMKEIFKMTEEEIEEQLKKIEEEKKSKVFEPEEEEF